MTSVLLLVLVLVQVRPRDKLNPITRGGGGILPYLFYNVQFLKFSIDNVKYYCLTIQYQYQEDQKDKEDGGEQNLVH